MAKRMKHKGSMHVYQQEEYTSFWEYVGGILFWIFVVCVLLEACSK